MLLNMLNILGPLFPARPGFLFPARPGIWCGVGHSRANYTSIYIYIIKKRSGRARARSRDNDTELFPATRVPPIAPRDEITPCGETPHSDKYMHNYRLNTHITCVNRHKHMDYLKLSNRTGTGRTEPEIGRTGWIRTRN